ncbi:MAG: hypothetical protein ACOY3Y_04445 [Acidobacteriota bacterium]
MSEQLLVCKALGALVRQHGEPTETEVNFVAHAALELALGEAENEEVRKVMQEGGDYRSFLAGITSRPLRAYLFRRVVAATLLDDTITETELAVIDLTARSFGYEEKVVAEYLAWMKDGIAWEKRGAELVARL